MHYFLVHCHTIRHEYAWGLDKFYDSCEEPNTTLFPLLGFGPTMQPQTNLLISLPYDTVSGV